MAKMTDMQELKKDMKSVVSKVDKIEQHLKDMNGKMVALTDHANNKCPEFRENIRKDIDCRNRHQDRMIFIAMGGVIVLGFLVGIFLPSIIQKVFG